MTLAFASPAHADAGWTCNASAGWISDAGQRSNAPSLGGDPCPAAQTAASGVSGAGDGLTVSGSLDVDGGPSSQTTDTRKPRATIDASTLTIQSADGLTLTVTKLHDQAQGECDANRSPAFGGSSGVASATLDGRPINTSRDYSEPGLGVNGAPLFGKVAVKFGEVVRTADGGLIRRAVHVVVTDSSGAVVFEAVGGEVGVGRDGDVCAPPPVCPAGTQPQQGRCVDVHIAPLPTPPPVSVPVVPGTTTPQAPPPAPPRGCSDTRARVGHVPQRRIVAATLCLINAARRQRHLRKLHLSAPLSLAAARHARNMVLRGYFAHDEPAGPSFLQRMLRSGYLRRFGTWHVGENLGWGWASGGTPRAIVAAWLRSPPHRRNIMNPLFRDAGIAVIKGSPRHMRRAGPATYVVDFGGFDLTRR